MKAIIGNVIRCSILRLWVGYFSYFKFAQFREMKLVLQFVQDLQFKTVMSWNSQRKKECIFWWWWWIVFVVWLTDERRLALFPAGTIVRDLHHRESPTRRAGFEPAQNLSLGLVEWSCAVVMTTLILSGGNFFTIYVLSQYIGYWINFQHLHTFTYQRKIPSCTLLLAFKLYKP